MECYWVASQAFIVEEDAPKDKRRRLSRLGDVLRKLLSHKVRVGPALVQDADPPHVAGKHLPVGTVKLKPLALHTRLPLKHECQLIPLLELLWQMVEALDAGAERCEVSVHGAVIAVSLAILQDAKGSLSSASIATFRSEIPINYRRKGVLSGSASFLASSLGVINGITLGPPSHFSSQMEKMSASVCHSEPMY